MSGEEENFYEKAMQIKALSPRTAENMKEVKRCFDLAAARGNIDAMYELGCLLQYGAPGVHIEVLRAKLWYEEAIKKGEHAKAMNNLGVMIFNGEQGVAKERAKAVSLYKRAAEKKNYMAMKNYGHSLFYGNGVVQDTLKGLSYLKMVVNEGDEEARKCAMCSLAIILEKGSNGVEKNRSMAIYLYEKSATEGYELARRRLYNLRRSVYSNGCYRSLADVGKIFTSLNID